MPIYFLASTALSLRVPACSRASKRSAGSRARNARTALPVSVSNENDPVADPCGRGSGIADEQQARARLGEMVPLTGNAGQSLSGVQEGRAGLPFGTRAARAPPVPQGDAAH